jgi:hypothetical protein
MKKRDYKYNRGERRLQLVPKDCKWINKCVVCGTKGYNPDMPPHHVRGYFEPLSVNELGICEQCAKSQNKQ